MQNSEDVIPVSAEHPTCGVVIEKNAEEGWEKICPELAADLVSLVDPDDHTRITAVLLVCAKHSQALDDGKELIFLSDNKVDHIAVRFEIKQMEEMPNDAE